MPSEFEKKRENLTGSTRFIYFDLGGVAFNFEGGITELSRMLGTSYEACEQIWRKNDPKICRGQLTPAELWQEYKDLTNYKGDLDFVDFWTEHFKPIPETHELMYELEESYPIGLLTNIYPGVYDVALEKGKFPDLPYAAVIKSCDIGFVKPEARIYKVAEQQADVAPAEIFIIDDSLSYISQARGMEWNSV